MGCALYMKGITYSLSSLHDGEKAGLFTPPPSRWHQGI